MATETAKIVVEGETSGATQALKETARATDEVTTASKAAGAELADLTRQTQVASKAQTEAAAALGRMRQAQDEAALTARAFGEKSKEAAEAQARLTKATEAAKRAEAAAKQELDQLRLGLAATAANADRVSPALARATRETERLSAAAERNSHELKKAELQQTANARASGKGAAGFDLMGAAGSKLASVLGPAALGATLMATGRWLGEAAQATLEYETALRNMPFSIEGAKSATHGLIGEQTLMAAASSATALKVATTAEDFNKLAEASVKLGAKLGQPADQLLNNLVTALGRGSTELLDNAGVVMKSAEAQQRYADSIGKTVDALTADEKASALKVEAMKAIVAAANDTTVAFDSNAAAIARFGVQSENAWAAFQRGAANAAGAFLRWNEEQAKLQAIDEYGEGALQWVPEYAENAARAAEITAKWNDEAEDGPITMTAWAVAAVRLSDAYQGLQTFLASDTWKQAAADSKSRAAALDQEAQFAERQARAYQKLLAEQERHLDEQAMASITYGPAPPPKKDKRGKGKKAAAFDSNATVAAARIADGRDETNAIRLENEVNVRADALAAEAAAIEENIATRERAIDAIDREIEAREAAGLSQDDLVLKRYEREQELLNYTRRASQDKARIAEAETRAAKVQHDKRLRDLRASYAAEQQETAKRQQRLQIAAGAVEGFGNAVVGAMEAEAEGTRGAIAKSLQAWLEGVRNQMAVKALVEVALGVASAAAYDYGAAGQHFTAAGLATAAAVAAGVAGAAIGAAVPSGSPSSSGGAVGVGGGGTTPRSGGGRDGNERQEAPLSFADTRNKTIDMPRSTASTTNNHATVTHVHVHGLVAGDERKLGAEINRLAAKGAQQGKRN